MKVLLVVATLLAIPVWTRAAEYEFHYNRPDAQSVSVMSEFNSWKPVPMTKGSDGVWKAKVTLPAGTYAYKFLVNGSDWTIDPENSQRKKVDGVDNSAAEVLEATAAPRATPLAKAQPSLVQPKPTTTPAVAVNFEVAPGGNTTFEAPIPAKELAEARRDGNNEITTARVTLGVPAGFDAQRSWPLLVISATVDMPSSSLYPSYEGEALDAGWVIMAADTVEKAKTDNNAVRWSAITAGLAAIEAKWPAARTWPVACAGFSGGAKRSGFMGGLFAARTAHPVIGMLMGGCNQDMASEAAHDYYPPYAFKLAPIFLSSGKSDTIATPEQHQFVLSSMKGSGFRKVKLESFAGAHDVYRPHTTEALNWFLAESAGTPAASPRPTSSFDSFFKKK